MPPPKRKAAVDTKQEPKKHKKRRRNRRRHQDTSPVGHEVEEQGQVHGHNSTIAGEKREQICRVSSAFLDGEEVLARHLETISCVFLDLSRFLQPTVAELLRSTAHVRPQELARHKPYKMPKKPAPHEPSKLMKPCLRRTLPQSKSTVEIAPGHFVSTQSAIPTRRPPLPFDETDPTRHSTSSTAKAKPNKRVLVSPYFPLDPFSQDPTPDGLAFELEPPGFGLIQERIRGSLFALVVQAVLWNRTTAIAGRPVLFQILTAYPTPEALAAASVDDLVSMIYTLGLHKRAHTLISLATIWLLSPPSPDRRYPLRKGTQSQPLLEPDDEGEGWEVAHLPGLGQYAMDSYRIFFRDRLRGHEGCEDKDFEPEWKNVVPRDKDLRAYLVWRWREEGWKWDCETGTRTPID